MARTLYWFVAGTFIGFGVLVILSVGLVLLVAGILLTLVGVFRLGVHELWAGLVGVGLLPLLILIGDLASPGLIQPAATARSYTLLAAIFGGSALVGLVWEHSRRCTTDAIVVGSPAAGARRREMVRSQQCPMRVSRRLGSRRCEEEEADGE